MPLETPLEYSVNAHRVDAHLSIARCKEATVMLDTDVAGRLDVFNPAELLLAALAACMIKSIERISPLIGFQYRGVKVHLRATRQNSPPKMSHIDYEIVVDTDEVDHRLTILHENVRKFGTVFNTVAAGAEVHGVLRRGASVPYVKSADSGGSP